MNLEIFEIFFVIFCCRVWKLFLVFLFPRSFVSGNSGGPSEPEPLTKLETQITISSALQRFRNYFKTLEKIISPTMFQDCLTRCTRVRRVSWQRRGSRGGSGPPSPPPSWRSWRELSRRPTTPTSTPERRLQWRLTSQRQEFRWEWNIVKGCYEKHIFVWCLMCRCWICFTWILNNVYVSQVIRGGEGWLSSPLSGPSNQLTDVVDQRPEMWGWILLGQCKNNVRCSSMIYNKGKLNWYYYIFHQTSLVYISWYFLFC